MVKQAFYVNSGEIIIGDPSVEFDPEFHQKISNVKPGKWYGEPYKPLHKGDGFMIHHETFKSSFYHNTGTIILGTLGNDSDQLGFFDTLIYPKSNIGDINDPYSFISACLAITNEPGKFGVYQYFWQTGGIVASSCGSRQYTLYGHLDNNKLYIAFTVIYNVRNSEHYVGREGNREENDDDYDEDSDNYDDPDDYDPDE